MCFKTAGFEEGGIHFTAYTSVNHYHTNISIVPAFQHLHRDKRSRLLKRQCNQRWN